jgi:hypothetical protein
VPPVRAVTTQVLLKTGDIATDGTIFSSLVNPARLGAGGVVFQGTTEALLRADNSAGPFDVVAKTGDPLPPPLTGTFNGFLDPAVNDSSAIAFSATLNSPDTPGAVCLFAHEKLTLIDIGDFRRPVISENLSVAYGNRDEVRLWTPERGSTVIVQKGFRIRDLLAVNNHGTVAFESSRALFAWAPSAGVVTIASERAPSPIPGTEYQRLTTRGFVLDDDDRVTFCARVRFDSRPSDGGSRLRFVTFVHDLASNRTDVLDQSRRCPPDSDDGGDVSNVATPIGRYVTLGRRAVNRHDEVAVAATRAGLYVVQNGGAAEPLVVPGDASPGVGQLLTIVRHSVKSGKLLFLAVDAQGPLLVAMGAGRGLRKVIASGDPIPSGGTFDLRSLVDIPEALGEVLDAWRDDVVVTSDFTVVDEGVQTEQGSGIFRIDTRTGKVRTVARSGWMTSDGFITSVQAFVAHRQRTLFSARVVPADAGAAEEGPYQGIFIDHGSRPRAIALAGERAGRKRVFERFGALATAGRRVVFGAYLLGAHRDGGGGVGSAGNGASAGRGIFIAERNGPRRIAITGDPVPHFPNSVLSPDPIALTATGGGVAFSADVSFPGGSGVAFLHWRPERLTMVGGAGGETLEDLAIRRVEFFQQYEADSAGVVRTADGLAFVAYAVHGDDLAAEKTLYLRRRGALLPLAATGEPTVLGGTLASLALVEAARGSVVYRSDLSGATALTALFRVTP